MTMPNGNDPGASAGGDAAGGAESNYPAASAPDAQVAPESATEDSGSGFNPAWNGLLEKLPTEFHNVIAPDLKKWDQNYSKLAQDYSGWKGFAAQGVSPEQLSTANQLYELMNTNPQEVYRRLAAIPGIGPEKAQEMVEDAQEQQEQDGEKPPVDDPRFTEMQQQLSQQQQYIQQRQYEDSRTGYEKQIGDDIAQLKSQNPNLSDDGIKDVLNRTLAQIQRGDPINIPQAYAEQQGFINLVMAQRDSATAGAPHVMSPTGGMPPSGEKPIEDLTKDERAAYFHSRMRAES